MGYTLFFSAQILWGGGGRPSPALLLMKPVLPKAHNTIKTILLWICLWWGPILAIDFIAGAQLLAEIGYFFNPCMSAEVAVEVTNDGEH